MTRIAPVLAILLLVGACQSSPQADTPTGSDAAPVDAGGKAQPDTPVSSDAGPNTGASPAPAVDPGSALATAQRQDLCGSAKVRSYIGRQATGPVRLEVARQAGATSERWIAPGEAVTDDFSPTRLNIDLDRNDVIVSMGCG